MRGLGIDATTAAVNVKTDLPAGIGLVGAAALTGHPLIAGGAAAALGLLAIRRGLRQHRLAALKEAPAAGFLLLTRDHLAPRGLLERTFRHTVRIAGGLG